LAGDENGVGAVVLKTTDGGNTYRRCNHSGYAAMFLSIAFDSPTNGVVGGLGFGEQLHGIEYTTDGQNFNWSTSVELVSVSQSVEAIKGLDGGFGVTGEFNMSNGVAITADKGVTWKNYNCSTDILTRYGSFPSNTTWYISAGEWPGATLETQKEAHQLTQRIRLRRGKSMEVTSIDSVDESIKGPDRKLLQVPAYYAAISKTADGGKTWKTVYEDTGNFYFNGIDCPDTQNCWVVGESESDSLTPGVRILHTGDGGATWQTQLYVNDSTYSLMDVAFVNATEGWACGGILTQRNFAGEFWHTSDGGKTWKNESVVQGVYGTTLSFVWVNQTLGQYVGSFFCISQKMGALGSRFSPTPST